MSPTFRPGPAERIRQHLSGVESLRADAVRSGSAETVILIKHLQGLRFRHTYSDFLGDPEYASATRFFLDELYGVRDFTERDRQFSRIAGGIESLFPASVAELAVQMTELHVLTETFDHAMAQAWLDCFAAVSQGHRYVHAWNASGTSAQRQRQLAVVCDIGSELQQLVRKPGLRTALRLMRGPARAAGLEALQGFLEAGFDAFGSMRRPSVFMSAIKAREDDWIQRLFAVESEACAEELTLIWRSEGSS